MLPENVNEYYSKHFSSLTSGHVTNGLCRKKDAVDLFLY
jgi:hypothetical protein